jgi:hypothetical protein
MINLYVSVAENKVPIHNIKEFDGLKGAKKFLSYLDKYGCRINGQVLPVTNHKFVVKN